MGEGGAGGSVPCNARCVEARLVLTLTLTPTPTLTQTLTLTSVEARLIQRGDEELRVVAHVARLRQARIRLRDRIGDALRDARLG